MAVTVTVVEDETPEVVIVKVAVVEPAGTVTVPGTVALVELEVSVIVTPPVGAADDTVTVPVAVLPPRTDVGEMLTPVS